MGQRAASYNPPAPDGSRPGTFQYTASGAGPKSRRSTIYHESVPGHHFQLALQAYGRILPGAVSGSTNGDAYNRFRMELARRGVELG